MKRYLIFCNGIGALIEHSPRQFTGADYERLYAAFIKQSGVRDANLHGVGLEWLDPEQCHSGVFWDWELAGSAGASYRLHILPDITKEAVDACKAHIRHSFDCVSMQHNRIRKLIDFELPELQLFAGVYPGGIVYSDRFTEKDGDYKRCGFLPFDTLELKLEEDCPRELRNMIIDDARKLQARRGQPFQTSGSGQSIILGKA